MTTIEILTLIIAIVAVLGVIYNIWKNGRSHTKDFQKVEDGVKEVEKRLERGDKIMDRLANSCDNLNQTIASFSVRIGRNEADIAELRRNAKGGP